jgi:hypothetical protein
VNANSLVTEDESIDKVGSQNIAAKPEDPMKRGTTVSNKSSPTQDVKAVDRETSNIIFLLKIILRMQSLILLKILVLFARFKADIFSTVSSSHEQFLQYEKHVIID